MGHVLLVQGDARQIPLKDHSVHCCVTSPPYWGLRDYGLATWQGGDAMCEHRAGPGGDHCRHCGAVWHDHGIGQEPLHDCLAWARQGPPCSRCYVCRLRVVFCEVWRVLRNDGTLWLNLGDSYAGSWGAQSRPDGTDLHSRLAGGSMLSARQIQAHPRGQQGAGSLKHTPGLKPKNLCGLPWRVALALQADGWYLRAEMIWYKGNPMPESVTDRPTRAHEQIFLLTKQARYFYDAEIVKEPFTEVYASQETYRQRCGHGDHYCENNSAPKGGGFRGGGGLKGSAVLHPAGRNLRSVWFLSSEPYTGAHYATMPTALVERCVKAGSSAGGACSVCGRPWVRSGEHGDSHSQRADETVYTAKAYRHPQSAPRGTNKNFGAASQVSTGWGPSCVCNAPVCPCFAFDPFCGTGTVPLVARALGRHGIGMDLSFPYLHKQARKRLQLDALAQWEGQAARDIPPQSYSDLPLFAGGQADKEPYV